MLSKKLTKEGEWQQYAREDRSYEIEIVPDAVRQTPPHTRENVKSLGDMRKQNDYQKK